MAHALQRLVLEPDSVSLTESELKAIHDGCTAAIFSAYMMVHYAHGKGAPGMEVFTVTDDDFARAQAWGFWQELHRNVGVMKFVQRAERHFPRSDARLANKRGVNLHEAAADLAWHICSIAQNHWELPRNVSPELSARECWDRAWPTIRAHLRQVELFDVLAATNALRREYLDASESLPAPNKAREANNLRAGDTVSDEGDRTGRNRKAGGPMSESMAHVPAAVAHAYEKLVATLDEEIERHKKDIPYRDSKAVVWSIERFVDALYQIEGGRDELKRRATLVETVSGPGSEYQNARDEVLSKCRYWLCPYDRSSVAVAETIARLWESSGTPLCLCETDRERSRIDMTLRVIQAGGLAPLVDDGQCLLDKWGRACRAVHNEAAPQKVDGCRRLWLVHEGSEENPSNDAKYEMALIQSDYGRANLKPIKAAASSLVVWATERQQHAKASKQSIAQSMEGEVQERDEREGKAAKGKARVSREEYNVRARNALKGKPRKGKRRWTQRDLAKVIGCSPGLVPYLPAYQVYAEEKGVRRTDKARQPRAVEFSEAVAQTTGKPDSELERLIGEQESDYEPSPLSPRRASPRQRRKL